MQMGLKKGKIYEKLIDKINILIANGKYEKGLFTKFINDNAKNSLYQDKIDWNGLKTKKEISLNIPADAVVFEKMVMN